MVKIEVRDPLPWKPSIATEHYLKGLVANSFLPANTDPARPVWKSPGTDPKPRPPPGYIVSLARLHERGFGIPAGQFMQGLCFHYKVELHNFGPNSISHGRLLTRTTGFLIDWNDESKVATLLTSVFLFRLKSSSVEEWIGADEYVPEAEVCVHLLDRDDTTVASNLVHYDRNYNLALLKVRMNLSAELLSLKREIKFGQQVFVLGRDKDLYLNIDHGNVQYAGPDENERHHYMFVNCALRECGYGAPVIDLNGEVMGMVNSPSTEFIPSATILKCLHMWKRFDCIPRLHIGMKFSAIKFLDPIQIEAIYRKCNIDEGLIVEQDQVLRVKESELVTSFNVWMVYISTTVELENLMLEICEGHLDKGNEINSTLEVEVGMFRTRNGLDCIKRLAVKVSDDIEVIPRDTYPVS